MESRWYKSVQVQRSKNPGADGEDLGVKAGDEMRVPAQAGGKEKGGSFLLPLPFVLLKPSG